MSQRRGSTQILTTTTFLNDYNFLRANKSIFPTFDNDFIITPTDVATLNFGTAVAISGDGSTLAIGATFTLLSGSDPAYVSIYRRKGTAWIFSQRIDKPIQAAAGFGGSIALSYDGSVLAVGAPDNQGANNSFGTVGCVALYVYNPTVALHVLAQIIEGSSWSGFGSAVALSATGQYLVFTEAAAQYNPAGATTRTITPAAYVYVRSDNCTTSCVNSGAWELETYLTSQEANGTVSFEQRAAYSSNRIDISADGSTIAFGLPMRRNAITDSAATAVFKRAGSTWKQVQLIIGPDPNALAGFGTAVALSGDGKYLAVRKANNTGNTTGSVYIYEQHGATYNLSFSFISTALRGALANAGGVAFSQDGTVLVVGGGLNPSFGSPVSGVLFIALRGPDSRWSVPFSLIGIAGSSLGFAVDCSADGAFVIAGEPGTIGSIGRAHVFRPVGSFIPNDAVVTGSLCVYNRTTIDAALKVAGNVHLNGTIVTGTAGGVTACSAILSDNRMKDSIASLTAREALDKLRELQPVAFEWLHKLPVNPHPFDTKLLRNFTSTVVKTMVDTAGRLPAEASRDGGSVFRNEMEKNVSNGCGFIAQDMQQVFPNFVSERPALDDEAQFIHDGNTKTIIIRAEVYAYLISALERLVEKNEHRKKDLDLF